ncbi:hypothetical protein DFQ01_114122 [Paenibacillus cellulosilyticus]|uniref:NHL repeat-containing protein n=1 Tax=Paenibacillus cellulosilyticus TaxID=375489 RepID=A0A2V2YUP4_9BACL|nr:hypothetical protein [Paenibacillus cellulosilyticus]PWV99543.1 hypothetical protein DFQ01_114122 [Paenibacillus cellulosilyticus]QKS44791.1 hypothetical protein HUB94_10465 [Paenibacillus cellulosilyticus]
MKYKWAAILAFILVMMLPSANAFAANTFERNYTYDYWWNAQKSLPAFELVNLIDGSSMGDIPLGSVDDVYVSSNRIFLADSTESRIDVFDMNLKLLISIKLVRDDAGKIMVNPETNQQLMLNKPEGVYLSETSNELFIADTEAGRIVVLDGSTYAYRRTIEKPANMVGVTQFKPSKIVVDKDGQISVVVQGSYEGIIQLNHDGTFARYFGLNNPRVNLVDYFWKSIASNQQKEKMKKIFAPSFNNLTFDSEGLIYATTFDASAKNKVFRFNSKGENVLLQNGFARVIGDLTFGWNSQESQFVDVAVSDYGVYALLDKTMGRVFLYNFDGDLMNIFGGSGNLKGDLKEPTAIAWAGDRLIVTDKTFSVAYLFQPTEFGQAALDAEKQYYNGKWEAASEEYEKTLHLNSNYDIAYTGVGRNYLMQDMYEDAMYYFELGNSRGYYSKAYNGYRNLFIQHNFMWLIIPFVLVAFALFYSEYRYNKRNG